MNICYGNHIFDEKFAGATLPHIPKMLSSNFGLKLITIER